MSTLISGGTVDLDDGPQNVDVLIEGERIAEIGPHIIAASAEQIRADGLSVLPGMMDFHVHMDDVIAGVSLADTYQTGSHAAALTGVTTLMGFVTQQPGHRLSKDVKIAQSKVNGKSYCDIGFHLTPTSFTVDDWKDIETLVARGNRTFKFYTTYKEAGLYQSYDQLREIFLRLKSLNARILVHCEDEEVLQRATASVTDNSSAITHAARRPAEAEIRAIERIVALAEETGASVHVVHVSTADGLERIQSAKSQVDITCETAPHYLLLNDEVLAAENGHRYLCTPPFRSELNRERVENLAANGSFDIFASDHCAFSRKDKDAHRDDVRNVPGGIPGVGALVPLIHDLLCRQHNKSLNELRIRLSRNPAQLAGIYPRKGSIRIGADADLVVLGENGPTQPIRVSLSDTWDPYAKRTASLNIHHVFLRGHHAVRNNQLTDCAPQGRCLNNE